MQIILKTTTERATLTISYPECLSDRLDKCIDDQIRWWNNSYKVSAYGKLIDPRINNEKSDINSIEL